MNIILETTNLVKKYKSFTAINDVNLKIKKGSIHGLVGKNGAGKTSLIRVICGLQKPTQGKYYIFGIKNSDKNILKARSRIGAIVESPSIYQNMTARDNLIQQYKILGNPSLDGIDNLLSLVELSNTGNKKVKNFSLGMKQRLGIAIALSSNPDILILDEPINGLDPNGIIDIRELILKLNKEMGITILISSHFLDELSKIATDYTFIDSGKILKEISSEELKTICKKRIEIVTNNTKGCAIYLEQNKIPYKVLSDDTIHIFKKINPSKLILELSQLNCIINEFRENDESLESYFLNLIGGNTNE